jgi:hypothetical protein
MEIRPARGLTAAPGVRIDGVMASPHPWRTWFRLALVVMALGAAVAPARARASYAEVGTGLARAGAQQRIDAAWPVVSDGHQRLGFERRVDFDRFGGSACVRERLTLAAPIFAFVTALEATDVERAHARRRLYLQNQSLLL